MKIKIESQEFEIKANGYFMKKYYDLFHANMMADLLRASVQKDPLATAQLTYCAIVEEKRTFEEWLNSFETPTFITEVSAKVLDYLIRDTKATVEPKETVKAEDSSKKKKS